MLFDCGKGYTETLKRKYAYFIVHHPLLLAFFSMGTALSLSLYAVKYGKFELDVSFDSFRVEGAEATDMYYAFAVAWNDRVPLEPLEPSESSQRMLSTREPQSSSLLEVAVFIQAEDSTSNLLTVDKMNQLHQVFKASQELPSFDKICRKDTASSSCREPISPFPFIFYSKNKTNLGSPIFDGNGGPVSTLAQLHRGIEYLLVREEGALFFDRTFNESTKKTSHILMLYDFGCPQPGFSSCADNKEKQMDQVAAYLSVELSNLLESSPLMFKDENPSGERIAVGYYGNTMLLHNIVKSQLYVDLMFAVATFAFLIVFMALHMHSLLLSICAMIQILVAFPAAYFFFHIVFEVQKMHLMNFLALFVMMGIGSDDVFVFYDVYQLSCRRDSKKEKMFYVIDQAISSTFITSFTTAAAFGSNLISQIPPIREFGLYMTLVVFMNYFLCITFFPACLVLNSANCSRKNRSPTKSDQLSHEDHIHVGKLPAPQETTYKKKQSFKEYLATIISSKIVQPAVNHPIVVLVVFSIFITGAVYISSGLKLAEERPSFLPPSHPMQRAYRTWRTVMYNPPGVSLNSINSDLSTSGASDSFIASISIPSNKTKSTRKAEVYFPPVSSGTVLPLVYFLPGLYYKSSTFQEITEYLDMLILEESMDAFVLVIPDPFIQVNDVKYHSMFYPTTTNGKIDEFIMEELYDEVSKLLGEEKNCTIDETRKSVLAHSLSGYGAFKMFEKYPNEIHKLALHSSPVDFNLSDKVVHKDFLNTLRAEYYGLHSNNNSNNFTYWDTRAGTQSVAFMNFAAIFSVNILSMLSTPYPLDFPLEFPSFEENRDVMKKWASASIKAEDLQSILGGKEPNGIRLLLDVGTLDEMGFYEENVRLAQQLIEKYPGEVAFESFVGGHYDTLFERIQKSLTFLLSDHPKVEENVESEPNAVHSAVCDKGCYHGTCIADGQCTCSSFNTTSPVGLESCGVSNEQDMHCLVGQSDTDWNCPSVSSTGNELRCMQSSKCVCKDGWMGQACEFSASVDHSKSSLAPGWALATLDIIFGVDGFEYKKHYVDGVEKKGFVQFDETFDFNDVHTQKSLINLCYFLDGKSMDSFSFSARNVDRLVELRDLLVIGIPRCLMYSFQSFLDNRGRDFPVKDGNATNALAEMLAIDATHRRYVGRNEHEFRVDWMSFVAQSTVDVGESATKLKKKYDLLAEMLNLLNEELALNTKQAAIGWLSMDLELVAGKDTFSSILISVAIATLSIFIFTQSIRLSIMCLLTLSSIITSMTAIFVLCGWKLGAIESISLSVIVGLSVDYCLHVSHAYCCCTNIQNGDIESGDTGMQSAHSKYENRKRRTVSAISSIGVSILGSAVTTAGASFFLLLCTIQVLKLFGIVILANTLLSCVFSLFLLPTFLSIGGPSRLTEQPQEPQSDGPAKEKGKEKDLEPSPIARVLQVQQGPPAASF